MLEVVIVNGCKFVFVKKRLVLLFTVLEEIDQHCLAGIDVDYEKLGRNRQAEADNVAEEVKVVTEYKTAFDEGLALISSGAAEQVMIDMENSW